MWTIHKLDCTVYNNHKLDCTVYNNHKLDCTVYNNMIIIKLGKTIDLVIDDIHIAHYCIL